ncbi:LOW QUALITY PROTEIN: hypothetical protein V1477_008358 [Vespula maculifrons]|uniref:Uncharacterized protein n=1 Tax=Vespula maculifrons TaxID=7453 RepID=A0ABD2CCS7_VESMC
MTTTMTTTTTTTTTTTMKTPTPIPSHPNPLSFDYFCRRNIPKAAKAARYSAKAETKNQWRHSGHYHHHHHHHHTPCVLSSYI